ncbi:hypothetical protein SEA_CASHLINE_34 [Gordonia phage Cashline]|nr:hypothetical protein SEA_CASHLINE_34 [Gordonia phage Cashline]
MDANDHMQRQQAIGRAFTPSAPMTDRDLFAGRQRQMQNLIMVESQRGQHALVYGVRGAGKTSLARVSQAILADSPMQPMPYHICSSSDTFADIWRGLLSEIQWTTNKQSTGFGSGAEAVMQNAAALLGEDPNPQDVARTLDMISRMSSLVLVVDEFDRPSNPTVRTQVADTIKILADRAVQVTIVLVGVAESVEELLHEHESIQRSLVQIEMPPMTPDELRDVITRGMTASSMTCDPKVMRSIVNLSQGLPHYTHLVSYHAALAAIDRDSTNVEEQDLNAALTESLSAASQSIRERYHSATFSNRETLYKIVLLACAMAPKDELGSFGAPDVREQLRKVASSNYDIPAFSAHLQQFSSDGPRGGILQRIGTTRRFRYRFRDPLMPTHVLMTGQREGVVHL